VKSLRIKAFFSSVVRPITALLLKARWTVDKTAAIRVVQRILGIKRDSAYAKSRFSPGQDHLQAFSGSSAEGVV